MRVGSQERCPPQLEGSIGDSVRIESDQERQPQSILKPGNSFSGSCRKSQKYRGHGRVNAAGPRDLP